MGKRKTISVALITERVNHLLAYRVGLGDSVARLTPEQAYRRGAASVLESVLHETGNYHGFGYVDAVFDAGVLVSGDESRRTYYS
jgi:hypothetical protein